MADINILLTGGTGFFGRSLLRYFLADKTNHGITISLLSRDPDKFISSYPEFSQSDQIRLYQGDIEDSNSLPYHLTLTHVLHAATDSTIGPTLSPLSRYNQIVEGTRNILDLAVKTGARRFLLTSSGGIYGQQPDDLISIPENWHGAPPLSHVQSVYSHAKRAAEHLTALYSDAFGLETIIARCFSFVGPDLPLNAHFAIGNFIRDALFTDSIIINSDGKSVRSYLDQRDLARWLWYLLYFGNSQTTYNVGSDQPCSILKLAHTIRDTLAPSKPIQVLGGGNSPSALTRYVPNINRIKEYHNLVPRYSLPESIVYAAQAYSSLNNLT